MILIYLFWDYKTLGFRLLYFPCCTTPLIDLTLYFNRLYNFQLHREWTIFRTTYPTRISGVGPCVIMTSKSTGRSHIKRHMERMLTWIHDGIIYSHRKFLEYHVTMMTSTKLTHRGCRPIGACQMEVLTSTKEEWNDKWLLHGVMHDIYTYIINATKPFLYQIIFGVFFSSRFQIRLH